MSIEGAIVLEDLAFHAIYKTLGYTGQFTTDRRYLASQLPNI